MHPPPGDRAPAQPAAESEEEDDLNRPILFSSSKANPSRWTVEHSLGRERQRPWWKVLPFSLSLMILVIWCFFKQETRANGWFKQVLEEEMLEDSDRYEEPGSPVAQGART